MSEHLHKDPEHVAAGYKATIHNPNVSKEAKKHAKQELHKMGIYNFDTVIHEVPRPLVESRSRSRSRSRSLSRHETRLGSSTTEESHQKNLGNVIGGYKATLKNPHASKEAKKHAEEELKDLGIDLRPYEEEIKDL